MARRHQLQTLLEESLGAERVYFQPPSNLRMVYPAIVYERSRADSKYANNLLYRQTKRYTVTVIDTDPDSEIPDKVALLPMCTHSTFFVVDNLNHDVFDVYF